MVGPPRECTDGSNYNCIYLFIYLTPSHPPKCQLAPVN